MGLSASAIDYLARDRGTAVNDNVTINLNGNAVDFIFANLGAGNNALTVEGGTVASDVVYRGGSGNDTLTVAAGTTVGRNVVANLGAGSNQVEMDGAVANDLVVYSRNAGDTVSVNGTVGGQTIEHLGDQPTGNHAGHCPAAGDATAAF